MRSPDAGLAQPQPAPQAEGALNTLPGNHSPRFAPVLEPTLKAGLQAMLSSLEGLVCCCHGDENPECPILDELEKG